MKHQAFLYGTWVDIRIIAYDEKYKLFVCHVVKLSDKMYMYNGVEEFNIREVEDHA